MGNKSTAKTTHFLMPTFADILFAVLFFSMAFAFAQQLLDDCDTGYHIRAGEYIIKTFSIPRQDLFSFISPPLPWTAHEWLSEVIMAVVHRLFGLTGVTGFFAGLIALVYYLLFRTLRRMNGYILFPLVLVVLAATSSMLHWLARPHIFSLLLTVVWYDCLNRYQYRGDNRLYLLPLLMPVWVNLHGGFVVGFILLGIYGAGNLALSRFGEKSGREAAQQRWRLILKITLLCLVTSLVNPFGYNILLFPFKLVSNGFLVDHIMEWMSPNFHEMSVLPFRFFLLLILVLVAASRRRLNVIEIALLVFFVNMALYSARHISLFAIIAAPIAARLADRLPQELEGKAAAWLRRTDAGMAAIDGRARGCLWLLLTALLVPLLLAHRGDVIRFDRTVKPVAAVEFMMRERIPGNMFNNDEFGDYIIYAAWPRYHVFIDGRLDMYGTDRIKEYYKIKNFDADWESVMKKYDMNWIIFDADSPFSRYLADRSDWRLIYADKVANIFVRNIPLYKPLIRKYPEVKPATPAPIKPQ